ncbi:hypothetical protein JCM14036_25670 [Desulfotomaculum defluvii]
MIASLSPKASLIVGILIPLVITVFTGYNAKAVGYSFFVGLAFWVISGLIQGAMGSSGDKIRAHYYSTPENDRTERSRWASTFFYIGLPGMIMGLVYLYNGWF